MNEPIPNNTLDSGKPWSVSAIIAIVLGLCSGPIMIGLVWLTGVAYGISTVGSGVAVIVGAAVAIYCIWAYVSVGGRLNVRGKGLALTGLIATVLWVLSLIALFYDIDAHLN